MDFTSNQSSKHQNKKNPSNPKKIEKIDLKQQTKHSIVEYIKSFDLSISSKLPREEELAKMLGVSRITLRSVLDDLAADGMIFRIHGKGTFINPQFFTMNASFNPVIHFFDMIRNSGYTPSVKLLSSLIEPAPHEVSKKLNLSPEEQVFALEKIFLADNKLCAFTKDYIPMKYLQDVDLKEANNFHYSLFYFLYEATGRKITWEQVELNAVSLQEVPILQKLKKEFPSNTSAYLLLKGINYDENNEACLYATEYIDTTVLKFNQIRKRIFDFS